MKFARAVSGRAVEQRRINAHRLLLRHLAKLGGNVFGPVPDNVRREFFCLDEYTWVWHEEWTDERGQRQALTTRYDVRPTGVLKSQGVNSYQHLSPDEEKNFRAAVSLYTKGALDEIEQIKQIASA